MAFQVGDTYKAKVGGITAGDVIEFKSAVRRIFVYLSNPHKPARDRDTNVAVGINVYV
jgi:hypothetical protein